MSGSNANFPAFLYANWSNTPYTFRPPPHPVSLRLSQYHQPRHCHQPSHRTMEVDSRHDEGDGASPRASAVNNVNIGEIGASAVATGMPPVSTFEDIFRADTYSMSQWREYNTNQPDMAFRGPDQARSELLMSNNNITYPYDATAPCFTPQSSLSTGSFSSTMSSMGTLNDSRPMKIDDSPGTSTLVGLPDREVDVNQFDLIRDETWAYHVANLPSLDAFSSPASSDAYSGPFTPGTQGTDEGTFPELGGNAVQFTQRDVKIENGDRFILSGSHMQHRAPSSMQHADFHPRQLSSWPTMVGHRYDAAAYPEIPAYTQHDSGLMNVHNSRISHLPATGSLQEVERRVPVKLMESGESSDGGDDDDDDEDEDEEGEEDEGPAPDLNDVAITEATHRRARDRYLLTKRREGWSYRDIKRMGKFREAESTLRGRVRVLTKTKEERVRRPAWKQRDIELLMEGVDYYVEQRGVHQRGADLRGRVPWKRISEWMKRRGSSYLFAPATCAKKWKEEME
ncbi:hypothetical protein TI39_contig352g00016 [Zymoseptoria brevis]|uniref:Myb-like domain-containing protein n=1 Tax=Zymoseptoria brevis TaxID=1047168 RepID=A0A0F4GU93_9PEZI|nr:hypothetical protein TI39_contig352g00016 [Zymoseptoria brevis]